MVYRNRNRVLSLAYSHLGLNVLEKHEELRCNVSSSLLIFANSDNMLYQTQSPCLHAGSIVPLFLRHAANPPPSPRDSTQGKSDRVRVCWQCEDSSTLYIWKFYHLLSQPACCTPPLASAKPPSQFFPLLFHPLLLSFLLTLAYLSSAAHNSCLASQRAEVLHPIYCYRHSKWSYYRCFPTSH